MLSRRFIIKSLACKLKNKQKQSHACPEIFYTTINIGMYDYKLSDVTQLIKRRQWLTLSKVFVKSK